MNGFKKYINISDLTSMHEDVILDTHPEQSKEKVTKILMFFQHHIFFTARVNSQTYDSRAGETLIFKNMRSIK